MPGIAPFTLQAALNNIGNAEIMIGNPFVAGGGGMASLGAVEGEIGVDIGYTPNDLKAPELTGGAVHQRTITIDHARVTVPVNMGDFAMWAKINPMGLASGGWSVPQSPLETSVLVIPRREVAGGLVNTTGISSGWVRSAGLGFPGSQVLTASGTAALAAVSLGVNALTQPLPAGTELYFAGTKRALLTASAAVGATTLTVAPLAAAINSGESASTGAPVNAVWFWRATVTPAATPYRSADGGKMLVSVTYEAMFDAARPEGHKLYTIGDPTNRGIAVLI